MLRNPIVWGMILFLSVILISLGFQLWRSTESRSTVIDSAIHDSPSAPAKADVPQTATAQRQPAKMENLPRQTQEDGLEKTTANGKGQLLVAIFDRNARPLPGHWAGVFPETTSRPSVFATRARKGQADSEGQVIFRDLPEGSYTVRYLGDRLTSQEAIGIEGGTTQVAALAQAFVPIYLEGSGESCGLVTLYDESEQGYVRLKLELSRSEKIVGLGEFAGHDDLKGAGEFRFAGLPPANYTLKVFLAGSGPPLLQTGFDLEDGEKKQLPPLKMILSKEGVIKERS